MDMNTNFNNQQAEQVILGSIIMNNSLLLRVADILEEKHFYFNEHKVIWSHFINVTHDALANEVTLKKFFENNDDLKNIGGVSYLQILLSQATGVVDIRDYAYLLIELWQKASLESLFIKCQEDLKNSKFESVSSFLQNELSGLEFKEPRKKTQHISEILNDYENDLKQGTSNKYISTGFSRLDNLLNGGLYSEQLCIIGARPSVGKTTIGQNIIYNASQNGKKCLFISLEVDKRNVLYKFLSMSRSIELWKIQKNRLNQGEISALKDAKQELKDMQLYVNDSSYLKTSQVGQIIKNQIKKNPVDLVVVDYVQILRGDDTQNKNEALIIKENTTMLKAFAKQYNVAVLALAQINRKAVEGGKQEPTINDFKGSGGIEEDADVAIILHRDRNEDKKDGYFSEFGKLIIAKNRHGQTGEVMIHLHGNFGKFTELEGV